MTDRGGNRARRAPDAPTRPTRGSWLRWLRGAYRRVRRSDTGRAILQVHRGAGYVEYSAPAAVVVQADRDADRRTGIYLRGACDLPGLFASVPLFREQARGTVCLFKAPGTVESGRADLLLQTLQAIPEEHTAETTRRLGLHPSYFSPDLFAPTFTVPAMPELGAMKKDIVVLSIGANVIRTLYRHKEHGFLVDPGGSWLNNKVDVALADPETIAWFAANFEKVGRLTVDEFAELFGKVVQEVRARTGARIVSTNVLAVEPSDRTHNFQLRPHPEGLRRRQFNLALVGISRELDVHILDFDRTLKRDRVEPSLDFSHFEGHSYSAIAQTTYRVLQELDAF